MTANASSSSVASPAEAAGTGADLTVELASTGLLPPLPAAYLAGRDRDLLEPLRFLPPAELPASAPAPAAPPTDRGEIARALEVANQAYGHPRAGELAARLADPDTRVVVAGQQPGLFGGPLYTLSKMVAASRWARALSDAGQPAVAVFWVATEDHDWNEVARTTVLSHEGPWSLDLGEDPKPLLPVGMRTLGPELERVFDQLREGMHGDRFDHWLHTLHRSYRPNARFGEAFCRLMVELLGERTPLLMDSMLTEVKQAQRPWLLALVEKRRQLEEALEAADAEIEGRGYDLQVHPQRGVSPIFCLQCTGQGAGGDQGGERRRIEWRGEGWDRYSLRGLEGERGVDELLERIEENPAAVSAGVLARPAIQDALLGTHLQLLGPGELAYMAQAAPVYRVLEVPAPHVAFRPQALVLEQHQVEQLTQTGLDLADLFAEPEDLERQLARSAGDNPVPPVRERVEAELETLKDPTLELDPNLERPWEKTRDQILRNLEIFEGKVTSAMARRDEVRARRVERLRETCLPGGELQERVVSSSYFPGKYRDRFADEMWEQLGLDPRRLHVVVL